MDKENNLYIIHSFKKKNEEASGVCGISRGIQSNP